MGFMGATKNRGRGGVGGEELLILPEANGPLSQSLTGWEEMTLEKGEGTLLRQWEGGVWRKGWERERDRERERERDQG